MHALCDILFYSELVPFTGLSRSFVSHVSRVAYRLENNLPVSVAARKYDKGFPTPIGQLGKARFWSKKQVEDWVLMQNAQR